MPKVPHREEFVDDSYDDVDVEATYKSSRAGTVDTGSVDSEFLDEHNTTKRGKPRGSKRAKLRAPADQEIEEDEGMEEREEEQRGCNWCRFFIHLSVCCCVLICGAIVAVAVVYMIDDDEPQSAALCNGCHCIMETGNSNETATCPSNVPTTDFSNDVVEALMKQEPLNAIPLTCNPYDDDCDLPNPLLREDAATAVCGLHYSDTYCTKYHMQTYPDRSIAEAAGSHVTHTGACGVCSTTQDLGVLLQFLDLETITEHCVSKSVSSKSKGQDCYQDLGFTKDCASLFADAARHSERHCAVKCVVNDLRDTPFNDKEENCALNECLQCKEDKTVHTFGVYAGRTKSSSGLLSAIARPCSQLADIKHLACPTTRPLNG